MDQVLAQAKVEVSATSKAWEPQRAYEKRLAAIMAKDKGIPVTLRLEKSLNVIIVPGAKGRKAKAAKVEGETSSEDETDLSEVERLIEEHGTQPPEPSRPRPRPKRLPKKPDDEVVEDQRDPPSPEPDPTTPRPRAKTYQSKAASKSPTKQREKPSENVDTLSPARSPDGAVATPVNKKRPRPEDEEEELIHSAPGSVISEDDVPAREATPAGDMQIRKKRARH